MAISGMTGLILPGMIDEPGCTAGNVISERPARGPDDITRKSAHILAIVSANAFSTPEIDIHWSAF